MGNQEHSKTSEAVRQPLHIFPAMLSLVCPGLGQLVQGRILLSLCLISVWVLVTISWVASYRPLLDFAVRDGTFHAVVPLVFFGGPLLAFIICFVLFSVLDAATWEPGKPLQFKKDLVAWTVAFVLWSVFGGLIAPAIIAARDEAIRLQCCGLTKQLAVSFHNYHDVHGSFPPAYTVDENGKPLHSWRVLLLPCINQEKLYEKIRLDEPWDSEYNRQFHDVQLSIYQCPASSRRIRAPSRFGNIFLKNRNLFRTANCDYSVIVGDDTIFPGSKTVTFSDITSGTSNTILFVERMVPVCWMDPNNEIRLEIARMGVNKHPLGIGSEHPDNGATVAFADSNVQFFKMSADGRIHTRIHTSMSSYEKIYESIQPLLTKSAGDATQEP